MCCSNFPNESNWCLHLAHLQVNISRLKKENSKPPERLAMFTQSSSDVLPFLAAKKPYLKGKTVVISGGSRGIGRMVALRAAQDGANVVIVAKTTTPHPTVQCGHPIYHLTIIS